MAKYISLDAVLAEIEKIIADETESIKCFERRRNVSEVQRYNARISVLKHLLSIIDTLEVKEMDNMPNIRFPHYEDIVEKVFGAGNLEFFEHDEAEQLVSLAKEELLKDLEVKEVDFWHKQSEKDIDDSIIGWSMHSFICLMKDGTTQEFTGIQDESYEGGISKHLDCVDDNYEWEYDDIVYWIEIPMIKAQKGE